ncbi:MAG: aminotransferase class V-fold PLP-dependent enzyme [Rhodothermales bacterium]|nr:aminotransferase class V-fold PLP-dependent enzyme [Rhodothermales bacterium]
MTPEEFRAHGYAVIDWIADYQARVASFPVLSQVKPGEIRAGLPDAAPEAGEPFERLLADLDEKILPGITHWQSPHFYAYFPANASGPAILGDLLSSGLGVQGMLWATSPACTELETLVMDWLVELLGLPAAFLSTNAGGGVIQDTASSAVLSAMLAGREQATGFATNERGCDGKLTVYTSRHAHSSIEKAAKIAGIGRAQVRLIEVDGTFAMRPDVLEAQIAEDRAAGFTPCFVAASVGTTSSTAIDPVPAIGAICRREGIWFHVDAAMAGTAALCPEFRWIHVGLELADSYCFNPHKWMLTNFDCSAFFVRDRSALIDTFSILPEYLRNQASATGQVIDYRDWHIQLGRRFRALKLWFVLRYYGTEGLRAYVRGHVDAARAFAGWVEADDAFELAAPAPLNLVCFRLKGGDTLNQRLLEALNASGKIYLTHTRLDRKYTLRLCVGQTHTTIDHVETAWRLIRETAGGL